MNEKIVFLCQLTEMACLKVLLWCGQGTGCIQVESKVESKAESTVESKVEYKVESTAGVKLESKVAFLILQTRWAEMAQNGPKKAPKMTPIKFPKNSVTPAQHCREPRCKCDAMSWDDQTWK